MEVHLAHLADCTLSNANKLCPSRIECSSVTHTNVSPNPVGYAAIDAHNQYNLPKLRIIPYCGDLGRTLLTRISPLKVAKSSLSD